MGDEREPKGFPARHQPSPEGFRGGTNGEVSWLRASTRLPGFPVAFGEESLAAMARLPVTVAGPRRSCTGFRVAPFVYFDCSAVASLGTLPLRRKGRFELCLELGTVCLVGAPFGRRRLTLTTEVMGIQRSDSLDQLVG